MDKMLYSNPIIGGIADNHKAGQNPLDRRFTKGLYLGESFIRGGGNNVNTTSIETRLNMKGGGNHENEGGCR